MSRLPVSAVSYGRIRIMLYNKDLKNALEANFIPAVVNDVHIVAIRCVFDFSTYDETVKQIAGRRRMLEKKLLECDKVWLIISSITALPKLVRRSTRNGDGDGDGDGDLDASNEPSVPSSNSNSNSNNNSNNSNGSSMNPGVSFWVGVKVPGNMLLAYEKDFMKLFSQCGFSIYTCKKVKGRNVESLAENACKTLFSCIKDYGWPYAVRLSRESAESFLREAIPGTDNVQFDTFDPAFGSNVVRITLTSESSGAFASKIRKALSSISYTGFIYNLVDMADKTEVLSESTPSGSALGQSKLLEAIDLLIFSFDEFSCRYNGGYVYEWQEESTVTFKKKGNLRQYIGELCRHPEYREVMTNQLNNIVLFFQNNPNYQGMESLKIDLNLREVNDGWFFNIEEKCFFRHSITTEKFGILSPRQYFNYDHTTIPSPNEYIQSLKNSFDTFEMMKFIQMLYQLLLTNKYPFKARKMVCVGPSNSGKTSWLTPILEILDLDKVATVTIEGRFAANMVKEDTQLIFVDEWAPDSMAIDEAKRVFQGGLQFIPVKHGSAKRVQFNSGIYVMCNEQPDFGSNEDGDAMRKRLRVFQCKSIRNVQQNMEELYKRNAMEIIHWMGSQLKDTPLFSEAAAVIRPEVPARFKLISRKRQWNADCPAEMDENVLTSDSVELAHMALYEHNIVDILPWRLVRFDVNSPGYHRSVLYGLTGKTEANLHVPHDLKNLFKSREKFNWKGKDSLYDVWLIWEGRCRTEFNMKLFEERYPDWQDKQKPFNLEEICIKTEPFVQQNEVTDVINLSD